MKSLLIGILATVSLVVAAAPNQYSLGNNFSNNQTTFTVEEGNSQQCIQFGRAPSHGIQYCITEEGAYMGVLQRTDLNNTYFIWNLPNGTQYCQAIAGQNGQTVPGFNGGEYIHDVLVADKRTHLFREALGRFMSSTFVEAGWEKTGEGHLFLLNNFLSTTYSSKNTSSVPLSVWDPPASCAKSGEPKYEWVPESDALWRKSHAYIRSGGSAVKCPTPDLIRPIGSSARSLAEVQEREEQIKYGMRTKITGDQKQSLRSPNGGFPTNFNQLRAATPVRNDAGCWSGWAFATAAALEVVANVWSGGNFGNTSKSWISVQAFLDCSVLGSVKSPGASPTVDNIEMNRGCYHGSIGDALAFAQNGLYNDSVYEYNGVTGTKCHNDRPNLGVPWSYATSTKYTAGPGTERRMMELISNYGAVVAETTDSAFINYSGEGVYVNPTCPKGKSHAVAILGWGEEAGVKYWLAKNSWGANWGDNGYLKIQRGVDMCGIESNVWSIEPTF